MNRPRCLVLLAGILSCGSLSWGAEKKPVLTLKWSDVKESGELKSGEVLPADGEHPARLRLANESGQPIAWPLATIPNPSVTGRVYMLRGKVRYENVFENPALGVAGTGFAELWNYFPDGSHFFTRTLGISGSMGKLAGTSPWREISLPFAKGNYPSPTKLELNVILPGNGVVELTDLELYDNVGSLWGFTGAWWDDRTAGLVGGGAGTLLGILGAIGGTLVGLGRGRRVVTALLIALIPLGVVMFVTGLIAVALGQPYAVYYPLLFLGGMSAVFGAGGLVIAKHAYQQHELRRMQALDAR